MTDWEHGRRFPTAEEALRAARLLGVDVSSAFSRFHPTPLKETAPGAYDLPRWIDAARGSTPTIDLAARAGVSRFAMGRFLRGQARPRLPQFFAIVDAATDRLPHLVAALVPIAQIPSLRHRFEAAEAARRTAYEAPWTEAVLRVIESVQYRALTKHEEGYVAHRLGIPIEREWRSLDFLRRSGLVRKSRGLYRLVERSSVDTRGDAARVTHLLEHWADVARERVASRRRDDLFAYNVFSLSRDDYDRVRELLRRTFREIRSLVAASEPAERVALVNLQLLALDREEP